MKTPTINARITSSVDRALDILGIVMENKEMYTDDEKILAMKTDIMKQLIEQRIIDSNIPNILNMINDKEYLVLLNTPNDYSCGVIINYIVASLGMCGFHGYDMYDIVHDIIIKTITKVL